MTTVTITDTGMRGFLKWARREYPAPIYQQIARGIQTRIPQAFSGYMLGGWRAVARRSGLADAATPTVDTADAANSTAGSPSWGDMISQIIGTATGAYLNIQQQQAQQQVLNTQLQQIQNGKPPAPISLSQAGITFGSAGTSISTAIVIGLGLYLGAKVFGLIK
jgi:hypothetical protein